MYFGITTLFRQRFILENLRIIFHFHYFSFTVDAIINLTCSVLQNSLNMFKYTFIVGNSTFGSSFHSLQ